MHGPDGWGRHPVVMMRQTLKYGAFRGLVALMMLASSALVVEAAQRWK